MSGFVMSREELFQQIIIDHTTGEETKDELREILDGQDFFKDDPGLERAEIAHKDRVIRQLARMQGLVDRDGNPLELVNVVRKDKETGKGMHYYVRLNLLTFDDQVQVVQDRLDKAEYFRSEAKRYYDDGCQKFGRKFQKLFKFD